MAQTRQFYLGLIKTVRIFQAKDNGALRFITKLLGITTWVRIFHISYSPLKEY